MMGGMGHNPQPLSAIWSLVVLLPSLAVGVRRLHDTGRSGWWLLIWLIPLIGWIILIWWFASRGDEGPNEYGDDPLAPTGSATAFPRIPRN